MAVGGVMQLVLNDLEERQALFTAWMVIGGGGVEVEHLPIHYLLAGANVADTVEQLFPIVAAAQILQALVIHGEAFFEVLLQHGGGITPEFYAPGGTDAVAYCEDHIKIVEFNGALNLACALRLVWKSSAIWSWESQTVPSCSRKSIWVFPSSVV